MALKSWEILQTFVCWGANFVPPNIQTLTLQSYNHRVSKGGGGAWSPDVFLYGVPKPHVFTTWSPEFFPLVPKP